MWRILLGAGIGAVATAAVIYVLLLWLLRDMFR